MSTATTMTRDWEPVPLTVTRIFRAECQVDPPNVVGDSGEGLRKIVPITSGFLASKSIPALDGATIMPGGSDYFRTDAQGKTRLDARYHFKLKDGHSIYFQSTGIRFVPESYSNAQAKADLLAGKDIDPATYYFRLKLILESDSPDALIQDLVGKIVVASAVRHPDSVVYDAYVVN